MVATQFDAERAILKTEDMFKPFNVSKTQHLGTALANRHINEDTEILLLNHPDEQIAFIKSEMAYHHVAQGHIAGEPYLVSF